MDCKCIILTIILILLFIALGVCIYKAFFCNRDSQQKVDGGSWAIKTPEGYEKYMNTIDDIVFHYQLERINQFVPDKKVENTTIFVGDIHGSLVTAFTPLIEAGIVEPASIKFENNGFICNVMLDANGKLTSSNKVVYCGDILGRGGNIYNLHLLRFILKLSDTYHNNVVFVLGNHEANFLYYMGASDDDVWSVTDGFIRGLVGDILRYILNYMDSIAFVRKLKLEGKKDLNIICSHTYYNDDTFKDININNDDTFSFKDYLFMDSSLRIFKLHAKIKEMIYEYFDSKNKSVLEKIGEILGRLTYAARPTVEEGKISTEDNIHTINELKDNIFWFIGHTQVQDVIDPTQRFFHFDKNGKNITILMLDVNTCNNYSPNPSAEGYLKNPNDNNEFTELYYSVNLNSNGDLNFTERVFENKPLSKFGSRFSDPFYILNNSKDTVEHNEAIQQLGEDFDSYIQNAAESIESPRIRIRRVSEEYTEQDEEYDPVIEVKKPYELVVEAMEQYEPLKKIRPGPKANDWTKSKQ